MPPINTLVFFDVESTNLPEFDTRPKITEFAFVACSREHFVNAESNHVPRVLRKLREPVCPMKTIHSVATQKSALDNYLLENIKKFDCDTVELMNCFLKQSVKPICLVAHYGNDFDFEILSRELQRLNCSLDADLQCVDSWLIFRKLWENVAGCSFKLPQIYKRLYGHEPLVIHTAEDDAMTLLKCAIAVKSEFLKNADEMCIKLKDLKF